MFLYFVLSHYSTQQTDDRDTETQNNALKKKAEEAFHSLGEATVPFLLGHFDEATTRSMHGTHAVQDLMTLAQEKQLGQHKAAVLEKAKEILLAPHSAWGPRIFVTALYKVASAPHTNSILPELEREILTPSGPAPVVPFVHGGQMDLLMWIFPEVGEALLQGVCENKEHDLGVRRGSGRFSAGLNQIT